MFFRYIVKVSPILGIGGRFVRGGISPAVRNSQLECLKQFERRKLLSTRSVRGLPFTRAFVTRNHVSSTALPQQMKQGTDSYTVESFPYRSFAVAARAMHLWNRPDRYGTSFHRTPSDTKSGFSEYSSLLQQTGNADNKHFSSSSNCTVCCTASTSTTSIQSSRKLGFLQDACVNPRTASRCPLYSECSTFRASRSFSTKKANSCSASSSDSRFPFCCYPTHSTYPTSGLHDNVNACCMLGNPSIKRPVAVVRVTAVKMVKKPNDEPDVDSCRVSDASPASKALSASTLFFAVPSDRYSSAGHKQASTRLQGRRSSSCTRSITKSSYNFTQACHISSTTKSSSSSSLKKQEDSTAFSPSDVPENLSWNWWDMYIQGINPDYPPRQRMFAYLTSQGVCVKEMEIHEVEEFTKYLEMRRVYGDKFPALPYDIKFEDKLEDLRQKYPLAPGKAKKTKKVHE